ncbi:MAG: phage GP46 family protein [Desulfobacteraceae bacterium]|nr:phage GP46 family protein [Desulfobacteraceae bacterium]
MDFKLSYHGGTADITWGPVESIANNIWLSLNIPKGSFVFASDFGHRFYLVKKNTAQAPALLESLAREALQWLLDLGRAASIEVLAQRDPINHPNRLLLRGEVVQADGRRVPFEKFVEVV